MKKMYLMFAGVILLAILQVSCSSEEAAVGDNQDFEFVKTPEMVNFESALQDWIKNKSGRDAKAKAEYGKHIEKEAVTLLNSFGISEAEVVDKKNEGTEKLINATMKEYSKVLTQMYNQRNN
jgi:hypothetical protein